MAFKFSTKVRNDMLGYKARCNALYYSAAGIALVDGGGSNDSITDTGNGLAIFEPGDMITVKGATDPSDDGSYTILSVAAGTIEIPTGSFTTGQVAGSALILGSARGGSVVDQFRNATIKIYTGSQPTSADDAETGSELIQITISSGTFTPGSATNGINLGQVASAVLHKGLSCADGATEEVWSGVAGASGTAGWFRIYDNDLTTGASEVKPRLDGSIATSGSQMNMANTTITSGGTTTIDNVDIPMAESV
jgi:hypothetical protein